MNRLTFLGCAASLLAAAGVFSCSGDDDDSTSVKPGGPASLAITTLIGAGNQHIDRADASMVSLDCNLTLGVVLAPWVLDTAPTRYLWFNTSMRLHLGLAGCQRIGGPHSFRFRVLPQPSTSI